MFLPGCATVYNDHCSSYVLFEFLFYIFYLPWLCIWPCLTLVLFIGPSPQGMGNMAGMGNMGGMVGMGGMGAQGLGFGFQNAMAGRMGIPGMQQQQAGSSVILVSNLDEQVHTQNNTTCFNIYNWTNNLYTSLVHYILCWSHKHQTEIFFFNISKIVLQISFISILA